MAGGDLAGRGLERLMTALGRLPAALRHRCAVLAAGRLDIRLGTAERALGLGGRIRIDAELSPLDAIEERLMPSRIFPTGRPAMAGCSMRWPPGDR